MRRTRPGLILGLGLTLLTLAGCGGSDGGGGLAFNGNYDGATNAAAISGTNATPIAMEIAFGGEDVGDYFPVALAVGPSPVDGFLLGAPTLGGILGVARDFAKDVPRGGGSLDAASALAVTCTTEVMPGTAGTYTTVMCEDVNYGRITVTAENFVSTSGTEVNGTFEMSYQEGMTSATLSILFSAWTVVATGVDVLVDGSGSLTMTMDGESGIMNILIADRLTPRAVYYFGYRMSSTNGNDGGGDYTATSVSGTVYFSDDGFVTISTPTPVKTYDIDIYPSSGTVRAAGAGGTWVQMDFIDNNSYQITACTDGDGEVEFDSGVTYWMT